MKYHFTKIALVVAAIVVISLPLFGATLCTNLSTNPLRIPNGSFVACDESGAVTDTTTVFKINGNGFSIKSPEHFIPTWSHGAIDGEITTEFSVPVIKLIYYGGSEYLPGQYQHSTTLGIEYENKLVKIRLYTTGGEWSYFKKK
jgi:hypothetical protein